MPEAFKYSVMEESKLPYNMLNSFKGTKVGEKGETKELISKLEEPKGLLKRGQHVTKNFTITPDGVSLSKGEELGMF